MSTADCLKTEQLIHLCLHTKVACCGVSCSVVENQVVSHVSLEVCLGGGGHSDDSPLWHRVVWWARTDISEKQAVAGSFRSPGDFVIAEVTRRK